MIGIIGAMDVELEKLKEQMTDAHTETVSGISFMCGTLWGYPTVAAVSGVGKVNAAICTQAMIMKYSPGFIINSGVAGGLEPTLKICDIVIADNVVQHDMDTSALGDPVGFISGLDIVNIPCSEKNCRMLEHAVKAAGLRSITGTIASGDQFINSLEKKTYLTEKFHAFACEMEGAAIGHVCFKNKIPFCVIRSISDGADDNSHISYPEFVKLAADNLVSVLKNFFTEYAADRH